MSDAPRKSHFYRNLFFAMVLGVIASLYMLPEEGDTGGQSAAVASRPSTPAIPSRPAPPSAARGNAGTATGQAFGAGVRSGIHLVDFGATWCGPCKTQAPIVDKLAKQFAGKIKVSKVDVDADGELAMKFGVRGVPTIIIFKNGSEAARFVGLTDEDALNKAVRGLL